MASQKPRMLQTQTRRRRARLQRRQRHPPQHKGMARSQVWPRQNLRLSLVKMARLAMRNLLPQRVTTPSLEDQGSLRYVLTAFVKSVLPPRCPHLALERQEMKLRRHHSRRMMMSTRQELGSPRPKRKGSGKKLGSKLKRVRRTVRVLHLGQP